MSQMMTRRSIRITLLAVLVFLGGISTADGCTQLPERVALEKLLNIDIPGATSIISQWPAGFKKDYYQGFIYLVKAYNSGDGVDEGLKNKAIKQLTKVIRKAEFEGVDTLDTESTLVLGSSRMYRAAIYMTQGKKARAYDDTFSSHEILDSLVQENPDLEDTYLLLGMYEFFLSRIPENMKARARLLSLSGDRELGLQYLERAVVSSMISAPEAARVLLVEANLSDTEMCRYQSLSIEMNRRFPKNELLELTRSIIDLQCNIARQEGRAVAEDTPFIINEGCVN